MNCPGKSRSDHWQNEQNGGSVFRIERLNGETMIFLLKILIQTAAILLIAYLAPVLIRVDGFVAAMAAAFVLGLVNSVLKPLFIIFTLPLTVLTFGLFLLVINGLMLWLVSAVVPGFHVNGFAGAVVGSLFISIVTWILSQTVA